MQCAHPHHHRKHKKTHRSIELWRAHTRGLAVRVGKEICAISLWLRTAGNPFAILLRHGDAIALDCQCSRGPDNSEASICTVSQFICIPPISTIPYTGRENALLAYDHARRQTADKISSSTRTVPITPTHSSSPASSAASPSPPDTAVWCAPSCALNLPLSAPS